MNKQELIAYLDVVCDAESAVQACEDAIALYKEQKCRLVRPGYPAEPMHCVAPREIEKGWDFERVCSAVYLAGCFCIPVFIGIAFIMFLSDALDNPLIPLAVAAVISLVAAPIWMTIEERDRVNTAYRKQLDDVNRRNAEQDEFFRKQLAIYQSQMPIYEESVSLLDTAIQRQTEKRDAIQSRLDTLYARDIIYSNCRNLIAAYQIREYLKMGICDGLEGPQGAYFMYMEDVRTARVCDSINDLKKNLVSAIHSLQGSLVQELRTVSSNLSTLQNNLSSGMQGISQQMQQMQQLQQANSAQLNAHLAEANRHLTSMSQNTAIIAHNEYVEQRMRNVDAYLLKWPVR